jgi:predicted MFS family arabinose efflux permease
VAAREDTPSLVKMLLTCRSTVFSATNSWLAMGYGAVPVGAILGGVVARTLGLRAPLLLSAAVLVLAALMALPAVNNRPVAVARAAAES